MTIRHWRHVAIVVALFASLVSGPVPPAAGDAGRVLPVCPRGCAYASITSALERSAPGDVIQVGPGIYLEHIRMRPGVTIRGEGGNVSIITGGDEDTVVRAYGGDIDRSAVLEGVTVIAGRGFTGGGIDIRSGASPTIRGNLITANNAGSGESYGGGVFISGGSPLISGNVFSRNYSSWGGGAIAVWDGSTAVISGNRFQDNKANHYGGGINVTRSSPTISGNTIISNTAIYGGGIDLIDASPDVANNIFERNTAFLMGGGLYLRSGSAPVIFANSFMTNTSYYYGGGLYMDRSTPSVTGNSFQGNDADSGGAIYVDRSSPDIARNMIAGNLASFHGGGMHVHNSSPTIDNNNIISNTATIGGGGLSVDGHSWPNVHNNTLANNAVGLYGGALYIEGAAPQISNNLIRHNSTGSLAGGVYVLNATPLLQNNTIVYNNLAGNGEGVYIAGTSSPSIVNNIIAGNGLGIVVADGSAAAPIIERNDVWNNGAGDFVGLEQGDNVSVDPLFVRGREGHYYLSHVSAGQSANSPVLDAGTAPASDFGLETRTTAVHDAPDDGVVDMGYHYRALQNKVYIPTIIGSYP